MKNKTEAEGLQYLGVKKRYGERLVLISGAQLTLNFVEQQFKAENGEKSLALWTIAGSRVIITAVKQYSFVDGLAICNTTDHYLDICVMQLSIGSHMKFSEGNAF